MATRHLAQRPAPRLARAVAGAVAALSALAVLPACGPNQTHPERAEYEAPAAAPLECSPDLDGRIVPEELPFAFGVPVSFLVSPAGAERAVDVFGAVSPEGPRVWDWSVDYADDRLARPAATEPSAHWFAQHFPTAQFVLPMDAGGTLLGVYRKDAEALWLLGIASVQEGPPAERTLLPYVNAVALYRFPIQPGSKWTSTGKISGGTIRGLPYVGEDTYEISVDAAGRLELPSVVFTQALRARTVVTVRPAVGDPITRRQVSFLFECFGEVARATSRDGETNDDFTTATEIRRFGF